MKKILLLITVLILGCAADTEDQEVTFLEIFDPGFPGGDFTEGLKPLRAVYNISAISPNTESIVINWKLPATYSGLNPSVYVFRTNGDGVGLELEPNSGFFVPEIYLVDSENFVPITDREFYIDDGLISNSTYTYMIYVESQGRFSEEARITASTLPLEADLTFPPPGDFWQNIGQRLGSGNSNNQFSSYDTMGTDISSKDNISGRYAFHPSGGLMYYADTIRNRVIVYQTAGYATCKNLEGDERFICESQLNSSPFNAYAVLGQPDAFTSLNCEDHRLQDPPLLDNVDSSCFTRPRAIKVTQDRLYVGDDNGRILVYNSLPTFGCSNILSDVQGGTIKECEASKVIGKANFQDFDNDKDISIFGGSDLKCPSDIEYDSTDKSLLIAESCRNRVVKVSNVEDDALQNCTAATFNVNGVCRFSAVLGQSSLNSDKNLEQAYLDAQVTLDPATGSYDDSGKYASHYFTNPTRVRIDSLGRLFVGANENISIPTGSGNYELRGRILIWDENPLKGEAPSCDLGDFLVDGCQATKVIGQTSFDTLTFVDSGSDYNNLNFTFNEYDFDIVDNSMVLLNIDLNAVQLYDPMDFSIPGVPFTNFVENPQGAGKSDGSLLPDFQNLSSVEINVPQGQAFFGDPILGHIFPVSIYSSDGF